MLRPWISNAYDPEARKSRLSGPRIIQIQTIDQCNGSCPACPYSSTQRHGSPNLMDQNIYLSLLKDLKRAGTARTLTLMLQNEPLLDVNLAELVRQAREVLGDGVFIRTVSNGTRLFRSRIDELFQAGIDDVEVSIDAFRKETYAIIRPGLDFARVLENTHALIDYRKENAVTVRFLKQRVNVSEQAEFLRYWERHGAKVHFIGMSNRAGSVKGFDQMHVHEGMTWHSKIRKLFARHVPCVFGPFVWLSVLWDGRVILCCQDWQGKVVLGDLSSQSLLDVWNADLTNRYRDLLWHGRFEESSLCRGCSTASYFPGPKRR